MPTYTFKKTKLATSVAILAGSIASLVGTQAIAQEEEPIYEEIKVFAQKREQSILEVPVSVTALSAETLERAQVRDVSDLQNVAPSLSVNTSSGASDTIFTIRGIGTAGQNAGLEQSVGVFIDGVYRGRPGAAMSDFMDISGVEVLKGPQGTLFGRNTSAGVISIRTAEPSFDSSGGINVSAGNLGYFQTQAYSTGALIGDEVAYRMAVNYQQRDGFVDELTNDAELNNRDRYSVRGQLKWYVNDDLSVRLIADYFEAEENCCAVVPIFQGPAMNIVTAIGGTAMEGTPGTYEGFEGTYVDAFDRKVRTDRLNVNNFEDWGLSAEVDWDLGETELTVIGAYRGFDEYSFNDVDSLDIDVLNAEKYQDIEETSVEIRLASVDSETLDWMVGAYFFNQDIVFDWPLSFGTDTRAFFDTLFGGAATSPIGAYELFLGYAPGTFFADDNYASTPTDYNAKSFALFTQSTWYATDDLSITAGLRFSKETKTADFSYDGNNPYATLTYEQMSGVMTPIFAASGLTGDALAATVAGVVGASRGIQIGSPHDDFTTDFDDTDVSGTISANYMWNDHHSTYIRYAQGYKSGGINMDRTAGGQSGGDPSVTPELALFDPENVDSFELGLKSQLLGGKLNLNATAFYQTLENYQTNAFDGIAFTIQNAAEVVGKGVEVDYFYRPNENWIFTGGLSLQDVTYDSFPSGSATAAQRRDGLGPQDLTGQQVLFTSDVNYSGTIAYTTPVSDTMMFTAGTSYSYRSDFYTSEENDEITKQDAYWMFNLKAGIGAQDESWAVELWAKNVTDTEVYSLVFGPFAQSGTYMGWVNEGRTFGVTGKYRF